MEQGYRRSMAEKPENDTSFRFLTIAVELPQFPHLQTPGWGFAHGAPKGTQQVRLGSVGRLLKKTLILVLLEKAERSECSLKV